MALDPYAELQIQRDATPADVRSAFLRAAKRVHPDKGGSAEAFARVKESYRILIHPQLREKYDRTGMIEEQEPDNAMALKIGTLSHWLMLALNSVDTPEQVDMIAVMKRLIRETNAEMQEGVRKTEAAITRTKALAKRFRRKAEDDQPNLMALVLDGQLSQAAHQLEMLRLKIRSNADTIKLIDEYAYDADIQRRAGFVLSGWNNSTSTS